MNIQTYGVVLTMKGPSDTENGNTQKIRQFNKACGIANVLF